MIDLKNDHADKGEKKQKSAHSWKMILCLFIDVNI